jgi:DNA-binding transcriptional LysR family regulator
LAELSYISSMQKGKIRVGITPSRAPIFFPLIFSRFNRLYPLVELSLREDHTSLLASDLMDGKIDFLIGLEEANNPQSRMITSFTLIKDRLLYFLASNTLLERSGFPVERIEPAARDGVNFSEIHTVPIILKPGKSKIHAQIEREYLKLNAKPRILIESSNIFAPLPLCGAGNAGGFMSETILRYAREQYSGILDKIRVFPVRDIAVNCDIALSYHSEKPQSLYFKDFIRVTESVFAEYSQPAACAPHNV